MTIGLLHPGEMGSSVGAAARSAGRDVHWASAGRSQATRERAERAGLRDAGSVEELVAASGTLLSVCPPHGALELGRRVAKLGFEGTYVDANAVSPTTLREIAEVVRSGGARFVDGGIIGMPAWRAGTTTLWLSGEEAPAVAEIFGSGPLEARVLDGGPGAASALKMCFAAWTKGTAALLMAIRSLAIREGVDAALLEQWQRSIPDLPARSEGSIRGTSRKAWRFVGEMEEIARSFDEAGLPDGFHLAAARLYARLASYKDASEPPSVEEVAAALLREP